MGNTLLFAHLTIARFPVKALTWTHPVSCLAFLKTKGGGVMKGYRDARVCGDLWKWLRSNIVRQRELKYASGSAESI